MVHTVSLLQLDVEVPTSNVALLFLKLKPIVGDFSWEIAEKGRVGTQEIKCAVVILWLSLQVKEVLLPKWLVIAVGDKGSLVDGGKKIGVAWVLYEADVISPHLYVPTKWFVFVQGR